MDSLDQPHREAASSSSLQCCCGRTDCLLLKRNCWILESVEKDVHTAAQLGQALLARHEAYMADAERDRLRLTACIERLQLDKKELEADNASKVDENNNLLEQLEILNNAVSDSDAKIRSLEASLLFSQQAVRRLESAAARAADAEQHLRLLEEEQDRLHGELRTTREEARSHAQRFKEAQRGILDMQDQLERMEKEACQERDRHSEMMEKMERQREVEKQLDAAALRLKGAAASKSIDHHRQGNNKTVGNFVRDLLQDNANLQLGIAELREMLINSNDEIQSLREQLMYHQPVSQQLEDAGGPASTLMEELEPLEEPPRPSQELHIHHHYHVSPKQDVRKPKRKRQGLLPGIFPPPVLSSRSSSPGPWSQRRLVSSPTVPALLSHARGDVTPTTTKFSGNWNGFSTPSSELSSSVTSSPHGFFDHGGAESDHLMSPTTSYDPMSPTWRASHKKQISEASSCSFQSLSIIDSEPGAPSSQQAHYRCTSIIHEEDEDLQHAEALTSSTGELTVDSQSSKREAALAGSRLHRVASHESIMSLSGGLDIHTLKARPCQMTLRPLGGADAVVTGVIAQPTMFRTYSKRSDVALRDNFAGFQVSRLASSPTSETPSSSSSQESRGSSSGGIGRWVGWRPWGGGSNTNPNTDDDTTSKLEDKEEDKEPRRAPGVNQPGAVPGFQQYWVAQKRKGAPAKVTAETIDREALSESLRDD